MYAEHDAGVPVLQRAGDTAIDAQLDGRLATLGTRRSESERLHREQQKRTA